MPSEQTIEIERRYNREKLMDLIGHPPGWLTRSGTGLVTFATSLLLGMSWLIRYPDMAEAPAVITAVTPPILHHAVSSGLIDTVLIPDGSYVYKGQDLCYLDQPGDPNDVYSWKDWLEHTATSASPDRMIEAPSPDPELGELQQAYAATRQKYLDWLRQLQDESTGEKIKAYKSEISTVERMIHSLDAQIALYSQEATYMQQQAERDLSLFRDKVISAADYEKSQSAWLAFQRQQEAMGAGIIGHTLRMDQLRSMIMDQEIQYKTELYALFNALQDQVRLSRSAINEWENRYIIRAQVAGVVVIPGSTRAKKYISGGDPVMTVVPGGQYDTSYARAYVPVQGLGRIKKGDRVILRLDAWPYKQYGQLSSSVAGISSVADPSQGDSRVIEVLIPIAMPAVTSAGIALPLRPEESGVARIITRERRVLERIFDTIISTIQNNQ